MPKKPAVPHELLHASILAEDEVIDKSGAIPGPAHQVWIRLSKKHLSTSGVPLMKPESIYSYVKTNRFQVMDKLIHTKGCTPIPQADYKLSNDEDSASSQDESGAEDVVKPTRTFHVIIGTEEWEKIKPRRQVYERKDRPSNRTRLVLPQYEWEGVISHLIWEQHKLPCPYTYGKGNVYTSLESEEFIKINAHCRECGATAVGRILTEPEVNSSVPMKWTANDTRNVPHILKRPLRRNERLQVGSVLQGRSTAMHRRQEAAKTMDQGDMEPPTLYSAAVLRKAKQQYRDRELGVFPTKTPIDVLSNWKRQEKGAGKIHFVARDDFVAIYHTPAQMLLYKKYCHAEYSALSIDATGSLVKRLHYINGIGKHIFLYEGVIHIREGVQLPTMQMLSERQDASIIVFWLNEWLAAGGPTPREVRIDNSGALKSAVARTFCRCSDLKEYMKKCWMNLKAGSSTLPPCFLRLDLNHTLQNAAKWKVWQDKTLKRLKPFYLKCFGLLIKATTVEEFRIVFYHIQVLAGASTVAEDSLDFLMKRIEGFRQDTPVQSQDTTEENVVEDGETDDDVCCEVEEFIKCIQSEAEDTLTSLDSDSLNAYYSPAVKKKFDKVAKNFLLWSSILVETFQSPYDTASSAPVESEFSILKSAILQGTHQPLQVDKFVASHLQYIDGSCKLAGARECIVSYARDSNVDDPAEEMTNSRKRQGTEKSQTPLDEEQTQTGSNVRSNEESETAHEENAPVTEHLPVGNENDGHHTVFSTPKQPAGTGKKKTELKKKTGTNLIVIQPRVTRKWTSRTLTDNAAEEMTNSRKRQGTEKSQTPLHEEQAQTGSNVRSNEESETAHEENAPVTENLPVGNENDGDHTVFSTPKQPANKEKKQTKLNRNTETNPVVTEPRVTRKRTARTLTENSSTETNEDDNDHISSPKDLRNYENWRGKGMPKKTKSYYLSPSPEMALAIGAKTLKPPRKTLLENGNKVGFVKMPGSGSNIEVCNTCTFDVYAQIIAGAYSQYEEYRLAVDRSSNEIALVAKQLAINGAVHDTYVLRCQAIAKVVPPSGILSSVKPTTRRGRASTLDITYDCFQTPQEMGKALLEGMPSAIVNSKCSEDICTKEVSHELIGIYPTMPDDQVPVLSEHVVVQGILEACELSCNLEQCKPPCTGKAHVTCNFGPHIFLDVDVFNDPGDDFKTNQKVHLQEIPLTSVPTALHLLQRRFVLAGVVARVPNHFIAYIRKASGKWEKYNDLRSGVEHVAAGTKISPVILTYIPL